jgi:hypothetical protein
MTRRGRAENSSGSKGCRGAEQGQTSANDRTGAGALRAALDSAVQLGRGDEVNRPKSRNCSPTKCRDSLLQLSGLLARCSGAPRCWDVEAFEISVRFAYVHERLLSC